MRTGWAAWNRRRATCPWLGKSRGSFFGSKVRAVSGRSMLFWCGCHVHAERVYETPRDTVCRAHRAVRERIGRVA